MRERPVTVFLDRKSTRLNSSHLGISYAVFCLKKNKALVGSQAADAPQLGLALRRRPPGAPLGVRAPSQSLRFAPEQPGRVAPFVFQNFAAVGVGRMAR